MSGLYGVPRCGAGTAGFLEVPRNLPTTLRVLIDVAGSVTVLSAVNPVAAPCVTLIGMPAMLIVADRAVVPALAETV